MPSLEDAILRLYRPVDVVHHQLGLLVRVNDDAVDVLGVTQTGASHEHISNA